MSVPKYWILNVYRLLFIPAGYFFTFSATGQTVAPDTVFIYETVTVYDTLRIYDTVRIYTPKNEILQPERISEIFYDAPATFLQIDINYVNNVRNVYHKKKMNEMNFKRMKRLSGLLLSLGLMTGYAQEPEEPVLKSFPAQITFVYPMSTHGNNSTDFKYNFSLNILTGKMGGVNGLAFGGLINRTLGTATGVQLAGLGNFSGRVRGILFGGLGNIAGDISGIQLGGLGNLSKNVKGIQFGGIINEAEDISGIQITGCINAVHNINGIQFGGLLNRSSDVRGIQIAGLLNRTQSESGLQFGGLGNIDYRGANVQIAGLFNHVAENRGFQFAGIFNRSEEATGAQIAGLVNRTGVLKGFQFGIISINDTVESGISMSVIHIVKKGAYREFALSFSDYNNIEFNYKMGTKKFYTIYSVGTNITGEHLWVSGFGFGSRKTIFPRIDFQPELISYQYYPENFRNIQPTFATRFKLGFVYNINERLGLSIAPSVYNLSSGKGSKSGADVYDISFIPPIYSHKWENHTTSVGFGISAGLILR
jgi:hypothetical protein